MSRYRSRSRYSYYPEYVPVAVRKEEAAKKVAALKKKGIELKPIIIEGISIAKTFWGKAWCKHLETYADAENRLARGRTYARNGSVINLQISEGRIDALVNGSSIYAVEIIIKPIPNTKWKTMVAHCAGQVSSLIELLQGKISKGVMEVITDVDKGLFPGSKEIDFSCNCPDYAIMCKHVAAVLYGIGHRLDTEPEGLFILRKANQTDLVTNVGSTLLKPSTHEKLDGDLSALFGIEIESEVETRPAKVKEPRNKATKSKSKVIIKTTPASKNKEPKKGPTKGIGKINP